MELSRLTELAKEDSGRKFFSIAHYLTPETLYEAFKSLRKDASAGVDGVTYREYEQQAVESIRKLHERLKNGTYRAQPLRRIYIEKEDGRKRPISIPSLEDKILQRATVTLLNAIYEPDFLDCSYGFRPGRGAQDALDEVDRVIYRQPTAYVLELDIASYFDTIVREQLMEMIEKRISDASILRLLRKWINVGVIDEGRLLESKTGTGQGQIISPLLANVYLHFVLDEWFEEEVKPRLKGQAFAIRYADDGLLCFERQDDAEKVLAVLPKRFAKYGLTLHPEKTRLVQFGRPALEKAEREGTKPDTFASSAKSVGEFRLRKSAKYMIKRQFCDPERSKTVGFSHGHFDLVVQTLDNAAGELLLGVEIVQDQLAVVAQCLGHRLQRLQAGVHHQSSPFVEEFPRPSWRVVLP